MENEKRLDLIDRGALRSTVIELEDDCDIVDMARALIKCVREAPTVDAVEVVPCDECNKSGWCIIEEQLVTARAKDRYCCLGERREGE